MRILTLCYVAQVHIQPPQGIWAEFWRINSLGRQGKEAFRAEGMAYTKAWKHKKTGSGKWAPCAWIQIMWVDRCGWRGGLGSVLWSLQVSGFQKKGFLQGHRPSSPNTISRETPVHKTGQSEELLSETRALPYAFLLGFLENSSRTTEELADMMATTELWTMSSEPAANPGPATSHLGNLGPVTSQWPCSFTVKWD